MIKTTGRPVGAGTGWPPGAPWRSGSDGRRFSMVSLLKSGWIGPDVERRGGTTLGNLPSGMRCMWRIWSVRIWNERNNLTQR
jgi:hypothetical protein